MILWKEICHGEIYISTETITDVNLLHEKFITDKYLVVWYMLYVCDRLCLFQQQSRIFQVSTSYSTWDSPHIQSHCNPGPGHIYCGKSCNHCCFWSNTPNLHFLRILTTCSAWYHKDTADLFYQIDEENM